MRISFTALHKHLPILMAGLLVGVLSLAYTHNPACAEEKVTARQLFLMDDNLITPLRPTPTPEMAGTPAPTRVKTPLSKPKPILKKDAQAGLEVTLEQELTDGSSKHVSATTVFSAGSRIRVHIRSNRPGYLFMTQKNATGHLEKLFPSQGLGEGKNQISFNDEVVFPSETSWFKFDNQMQAREEIMIYLLEKSDSEFSRLFALLPEPSGDVAAPSEEKQVAQASKTAAPFADLDERITIVTRGLEAKTRGLVIDTGRRVDPKNINASQTGESTFVVSKMPSTEISYKLILRRETE